MSPFEKAARAYILNHGFHVFPCSHLNKRPLTKNGFNDATQDLRQISKWSSLYPNAKTAIATDPSGIAVLDFDSKPEQKLDAYESLAELEMKHGQLPETPQVLTGGKGLHCYFKVTEQLPRIIGLFKCVDFLTNGYVIAPPSPGYVWENFHRIDEIEIAPIPDWLTK